jgi:hypothetical protein
MFLFFEIEWPLFKTLKTKYFPVRTSQPVNNIHFSLYTSIEANYYMVFQNSLFSMIRYRKTHIRTVVRIFPVMDRCPGCRLSGGKISFRKQKRFFLLNFPTKNLQIIKNVRQPNCFLLGMHVYSILLPSETDDSRFNSREKHMLTDSMTTLVTSVLWNIIKNIKKLLT